MKNIRYILILLVVFGATSLFAQTQKVSKKNTNIKWIASKVGGSHDGTIELKEGSLTWSNDEITAGKFVVNMKSVKNSDIENKDYNKKLVDHIKSDDFFGVDEFPLAVLEITEGSSFNDGKSMMKGNLTIRDKTHPVEFEVVKESDKLMAKLTIDRSKYDVKYRSKSFFKNLGDKLIHDDFTLEISVMK
jgi:polyisoprenoid-binding protein YceI